jgi:hypothetical protein
VNYLIPKRVSSSEREVLDQMDKDDQEVAVESASVHVESGSHPMRLLYVPSTSGEGTAVFATNLRVGPEEAETFCQRYSRRWQIESEYKSIKGDFLAKTSSKDYRVRLFYFVFAVLLYNIWRLTDFLLKADIDGEMDYAPVIHILRVLLRLQMKLEILGAGGSTIGANTEQDRLTDRLLIELLTDTAKMRENEQRSRYRISRPGVRKALPELS